MNEVKIGDKTVGENFPCYLVAEIGVLPIFIPNNLSDVKNFLKEMQVNGLILSGGDNIGDNPERDETEKKMIEFATQSKISILGVCRGMQVINKYFGGNILANKDSKHVAKPHKVEISPPISELLETNIIQVNSYHNNTIPQNMLGKGLQSFAMFPEDHTVEGLYHKDLPFSGVMWHPEREQNQYNLLIVKRLLTSVNNIK